MRSLFYVAVAAVALAQVGFAGEASAQGRWRVTPPKQLRPCTPAKYSNGCSYYIQQGKPWWPKQGAPVMEGQWRKECKDIAGPEAEVAIYEFNPVWIQMNCYARHTIRKG